MRAHGANRVIAMLRNVAEKVPDKARKTMHRNADKMVELAKLNTPVDTYSLEESIHKETSTGARDAGGHGGRLQIDVVAGGMVGDIDTSEYVEQIHENYESMTPGLGTLAKRAAHPDRYIGSKFLDRAAEEVREKLEKDMIETVTKAIREEDR